MITLKLVTQLEYQVFIPTTLDNDNIMLYT